MQKKIGYGVRNYVSIKGVVWILLVMVFPSKALIAQNVGIGTNNPVQKLTIASSQVNGAGNSDVLGFYAANPLISFASANGTAVAYIKGVTNTAVTPQYPYEGLEIGTVPGRFIYLSTSYGPRLTINEHGDVGIGITNPKDALSILRNGDAAIRLKNAISSSELYISTSNTGVYFTTGFKNLDIFSSDLIINSGRISIRSGLEDFKIVHVANPRVLAYFFNNQNISYIGSNGTYYTISDSTLKTTKQKVEESIASKLSQLQLYRYRFLHEDANAKLSIGFMAQNVQREFPELVQEIETDGKRILTVDASKYGVIAIKAIQEQQQLIVALQQQNKQLTERIEKLEQSNK